MAKRRRLSKIYFPSRLLILIFTRKIDVSRKALAFYRDGDNEKVRKEMEEIIDAWDTKCKQPKKSILCVVLSGQFWRPFSCVGVLFILFRLTSFSILSHYAAPFLEKAHISLNPLLMAVIFGLIRLVSSLVAFVILSFASKRTTFILTGLVSVIGILIG